MRGTGADGALAAGAGVRARTIADAAPAAAGAGASGVGPPDAESAMPPGAAGPDDGHHATAVAPTSTSAATRKPPAGRQRPRSGTWRGSPTARAQGVAVLDVDTVQPIRSCPYWFQIGLLPFVNEV